MTSLQRLSLDGNRLTSLPKEPGDLHALWVLSLQNNRNIKLSPRTS